MREGHEGGACGRNGEELEEEEVHSHLMTHCP